MSLVHSVVTVHDFGGKSLEMEWKHRFLIGEEINAKYDYIL